MIPDEGDLIKRSQAGDESALIEIYNQHYRSVLNFIYYRVEERMLAEDLTTEVFLKMVTKINQFVYRGRPILGWLYQIARNLIIDYYRKHKPAQEPIALSLEITGSNENLLEHLIERKRSKDIMSALQHLSEEQQQVILLRFIEGFSNAETAALLNKSEGAVKSLQHRALARLRQILGLEFGYETR